MSLVRHMLFALTLSHPACSRAQAPVSPLPTLSADSVRAVAGEPLAPDLMRRDLALLAEAFEALHPGLYRYQTRAVWRTRVDSLDRWFRQPRSRGESYLALAQLTAALRCSHTYLNFWNQSRETKQWLHQGADKLPFTFHLDGRDRWVVLRSAVPADLLQPGDTIIALDEHPTDHVIAELLPLVRGDGDNDGKRRSLVELTDRKVHETLDVLLPLRHPPTEGRYRLRVRRGPGHADGVARDTTLTVATMAAATRRASAVPVRGDRPNAELTFDGAVGILRVDGFEFASGWGRYLRETFATLRARAPSALVLDLRENEGGSDEGALELLRYLIRGPVALPPVRQRVAYETVSPTLRPFLQTWDDDFYDRRGTVRRLADGGFELTRGGGRPDVVRPVGAAYEGRIVILTGPVNSSASHQLIRLLKGQPHVTLVGAPTGGSLRASTGGNIFFLRLPGSGLEVDIPLIGYESGDDQPSGGVPPDFVTSEREAMTAALALLRATASPSFPPPAPASRGPS